jgi:hypothetical protein
LTLSAAGPLEVVMTRFSPLPVLVGWLLAVSVTACGGDSGVDPAAAEDGVSASQTGDQAAAGAGQDAGSGNSGGAAEAAGGARPGGPEPESVGARPGGPFDLEAFENIGGPFGGLKASVAGRCGGGACSLGKPEIISGDPGAVDGGVDQCRVDSITYAPASQVRDGSEFFQAGSAVVAHLDCTTDDGGAGTTAAGSSPAGSTAAGTSAGSSADDGTADGEPAG